jgi:hypothetical protein
MGLGLAYGVNKYRYVWSRLNSTIIAQANPDSSFAIYDCPHVSQVCGLYVDVYERRGYYYVGGQLLPEDGFAHLGGVTCQFHTGGGDLPP